MPDLEIPRKAVYRLSLYQRCLQRLQENEVETVSSQALAKAAGVKPTQLRKDLAYFGQFGKRGLGYDVAVLAGSISEALGRTSLQPVILIGAGNLGSALLRYQGFRKEGFEIVAAFDADPMLVGRVVQGVPVRAEENLADFLAGGAVKMAILAVPAEAAQRVANELVGGGVQAILNFSPIVLEVPDEVMVNHVDLAIELENLSYFVR